MHRLTFQEFAITALFGLAAAWLWPASIGLLSAYFQLPVLSALATNVGGDVKTWAPIYMFVSEILLAAICALIIVFPLSWLVRGRALLVWGIFGGAFLVASTVKDPLSFYLALYFGGPSMFLVWSFAFLKAGESMWRRNAVA